ncbi:MAG TPA: Gfo/Idh/MocA family oxidoreductase [Victivallales bacterium]|nr:Gfo/Idh/MocA family oxidoreductase [Victivallales bacterium]HRR28235.1 Gfo/Idh/MocA family oxidoreductase [Victivallales bacterium]
MKELRFAVIGVGNMGSNHVKFIKNVSGAKIVAICDIDRQKADKIADEHKVQVFYDAKDLYKSEICDAVIISVPHYDHTLLTIQAFEAGLHVLCEKPIAVHKADALKMCEAHKKHSKLKFAIMFQQRTDPYYIKLKSLIDKGELGKIYRISWTITNWFRTQAYYNSGGWRATWRGEGGGVLLNQCPHNIDLFQWMFGMPSRVHSYCALGKYHDIEVEDDVTAFFEYSDGKTASFITSTGEFPGTNRLEIACDRGKVVAENGKITFSRTEEKVSEFNYTTSKQFEGPDYWNIDIPYKADNSSRHQCIIQNFTNSILKGDKLVARGEEGCNSIELANVMLLSSLEGKSIELPIDHVKFEKKLKELIKNSKYVKKVEKSEDSDFTSSFSKK